MQTNPAMPLCVILTFASGGCDVPPHEIDGASSESAIHAAPRDIVEGPGEESARNATDVPADWVPLAIHGFSIWMPPDYKYRKMLSPDSFLGVIEAEGVFLVFDYGWYSDLTKTYRNKPGRKETNVTLDGEEGYLWRYTDRGDEPYLSDLPERPLMKEVLLLNVPKITGSDNGLWVRARFHDDAPETEKVLERVLRSVTFLRE